MVSNIDAGGLQTHTWIDSFIVGNALNLYFKVSLILRILPANNVTLYSSEAKKLNEFVKYTKITLQTYITLKLEILMYFQWEHMYYILYSISVA